jgi:seryl-tRNA synthetase
MDRIKLVSDEFHEKSKQNKSDIKMLMEQYQDLTRDQEDIENIKKEIKKEICNLVRERGEQVTDKTTRYNGDGYFIDVVTREYTKFKDGLINYCRQNDFLDCIDRKESINKNKIMNKFYNGEIGEDIFNNFVSISYTDILDIHNL